MAAAQVKSEEVARGLGLVNEAPLALAAAAVADEAAQLVGSGVGGSPDRAIDGGGSGPVNEAALALAAEAAADEAIQPLGAASSGRAEA